MASVTAGAVGALVGWADAEIDEPRGVRRVIIGLGISAACAFGALIALLGVVGVALPGRPEPWPVHLLQRGACMTAAAMASIYSLGFFGVAASESEFGDGADSIPAPACRDGFSPETVKGLSHHSASYLPLRFDCIREDGSSYPSDPNYVWMNWASLTLTVATVLLAVGAAYVSSRRA